LLPSFPNFIWERNCLRNFVAARGGWRKMKKKIADICDKQKGMSKPPANKLLWEGLPFLMVLGVQLLCLTSSKYRADWLAGWINDPYEAVTRIVALSLIFVFLALASVILRLLRRWWPTEDAPDYGFRIVCPVAAAIFLAILAALVVATAPFLMDLDADGQEEQSRSP
jgi:hypothetical protein